MLEAQIFTTRTDVRMWLYLTSETKAQLGVIFKHELHITGGQAYNYGICNKALCCPASYGLPRCAYPVTAR